MTSISFDVFSCMLVLLTSKVDGTADCHQEVDKDWSDSDEPDVPGIAEGEGLISSILRTVDHAVADLAGTDLVSLGGVTEEEVGFYCFQRAPLCHRELPDLQENEDGELVLKGDRGQGAGASRRIWFTSLAVKIQRRFVVFCQHLKELIGDRTSA